MNKYINIEKIKTILQEVEAPDCSLIELLGALKEIATILEQPSADVVEVVRCKDCKYREKYECNHITLGSTKCGVTDDFYCADGERKESKVKKCFDIPKEDAEMLLEGFYDE